MRQVLLLIFLFVCVGAWSQSTQYLGAPNVTVQNRGHLRTDSSFQNAIRDTTFTPSRLGIQVLRPQDTTLYYSVSTTTRPYWSRASSANGGTLIARHDSIFVYTKDTVFFLTTYIPARNDTFYVQNGVAPGARLVHPLNDSTVIVWRINAGSNITLDTSGQNVTINADVSISPLDTASLSNRINLKVDSVTYSASPFVDTLFYWINGVQTLIGYNDRTADGLISGGIVTHRTGLIFDVSPAVYRINGIRYSSPLTSVTLATADATNPRIDVIAVNTSGQAIAITGTPATNPATPQINPSTQLYLTSVLIPAGATTPSGVSSVVVYDENAGTPTEYNTSTTGTVSVNYNSTAQSFNGTKSAAVASASGGAGLLFTGASPVSLSNYTSFSFWVRLTANMTNQQSLSVQFYNGTTAVSSSVTASFSKNSLNTWQNVGFNLSQFTFPGGNTADRVRITISGTITSTFYVDYLRFQGGISQPSPPNVYTAGYGLLLNNNQFSADTSLLATRPRLQKVADSLAALIGAGGGNIVENLATTTAAGKTTPDHILTGGLSASGPAQDSAIIKATQSTGSTYGSYLHLVPTTTQLGSNGMPWMMSYRRAVAVNPTPRNGDVDNYVWDMGTNMTSAGGVADANRPGWRMQFEHNYQTLSGDSSMAGEHHLIFHTPTFRGVAGKDIRMMSWGVNHEANAAYMYMSLTKFQLQDLGGSLYHQLNSDGSEQLFGNSAAIEFQSITTGGSTFLRYNGADVLTANKLAGGTTTQLGIATNGIDTIYTGARQLSLNSGSGVRRVTINAGTGTLFIQNPLNLGLDNGIRFSTPNTDGTLPSDGQQSFIFDNAGSYGNNLGTEGIKTRINGVEKYVPIMPSIADNAGTSLRLTSNSTANRPTTNLSANLHWNSDSGRLEARSPAGTWRALAWAGEGGSGSGGSSQWTTTGSDIYYNTGKVLIAQTSSGTSEKLQVTGAIYATGDGTGTSYWVPNGNAAIRGKASSNGSIYIDAAQDASGTVNLRTDISTRNVNATLGIFGGSEAVRIADGGAIRGAGASNGDIYIDASQATTGTVHVRDKLEISGQTLRIATSKTPSSATDTGTAGMWCWDANFIYVCTATNTWKRIAISTW